MEQLSVSTQNCWVDTENHYNSLKINHILIKFSGVVEYSMENFGLNFHNDWLDGCRATALFAIHPKPYVDSES